MAPVSLQTPVGVRLDGFRKRDGQVVSFESGKIESAIIRAAEAVVRREGGTVPADAAAGVTTRVVKQLIDPASEYYVGPDESGRYIADIENVQDLVEICLAESGQASIVAIYKRYRRLRDLARERIRVRNTRRNLAKDVTDASLLLVESMSQGQGSPWDRSRIVQHITETVRLPLDVAVSVAKAVENQLVATELKMISTRLIRELVNNELSERGYHEQLRDLSVYAIPRDFLESLLVSKSVENSNIVNNNPEAVNLGIAEMVLKQWALDTIFSNDVRKAHETGMIHLHDLGYPHRVYCSSHSIEYVKKYGLQDLLNLNTESKPARSASVLTGHLNTFLASMQSNYAGALGIAYINILYAPMIEGMSRKQLKQIAQELIFNGSQNAFSRGGQTLFLDFNIHSGVPSYLMDVPAVGPGGSYMLRNKDGAKTQLIEVLRDDKDVNGNQLMDLFAVEPDGSRRLVLRELAATGSGITYDPAVQAELQARGETIVTYGDYVDIARDFACAMLEVWGEGDKNGRVFEFPKCDFHISAETFEDPAQYSVFMQACELAGKNGSTYFIFDRDAVTLSACCRLRTTIQDNRMLRHPESLRFCGFQNITINIPQAAYRAARNGMRTIDGLLGEIDRTMALAIQAHLQKRAMIADMMSGPGRPLWQIGRKSCDGRPYVELDKCTYIIGLIGVNDAVKFITGNEFHESADALDAGLKIVAHMYLRAREATGKHGLKFSLEESPAESAARRLAKADLQFFPEEARATIRGESEDVAFYTNSIHLAADADVSLVERIRQQSKFHSLIESGAIIHAFVGEERPSAESIARLARETFFRTQAAQLTVSPEFSYCEDCMNNMSGLRDNCDQCGSIHVVHETRVVGYFSKIENWNKSKRHGELVARHRGRYSVETADPISSAAAN